VGETQAWRRQGSAEILANLVRIVEEHFAPILVGRSPFDVADILHRLNTTLYNSLYAQAAVGDALYDLMGRLLGVPVHDLLGGRCRDSIGIAAVLSMKPSTSETVAEAETYYERGFRHFGVKIGVDSAADLANVKALRERFGDQVVLRVDANAALSYDAALGLLRKLEPYDIDAAEQPVALWDLDGMAALSRAVAMPIMADESVSTDHSLLDVIKKRAASVVQTKVAKNGGIHYIQKLWHLAAAAGMRIYPGNHPSLSIATASVAHLCAAWPGPLMEGVFAVGVTGALADDVVETPLRPENGAIRIPDGPGFGVALDEDRVAALRVDR
ncbi:MAG: hypothetical protein MJE12_30300, partial [Alphaproteobacteria bacterium]|nr:hypothetical protein [Alphaproteobacteria bacterium]